MVMEGGDDEVERRVASHKSKSTFGRYHVTRVRRLETAAAGSTLTKLRLSARRAPFGRRRRGAVARRQ